MKRLEYGAYKLMTPEQKLERKRMLQKRWRLLNKDKVSENNHKWFVHYKKTKPFMATCAFCGKNFNATRDYYLTCPDCMKARHDNYVKSVLARKTRVKAKEDLYNQVLAYHDLGLTQTDIAGVLNISQSRVSYIINTRRQKKEV